MKDLLDFLNGRIIELEEARKECQDEGDFATDDYLAGAIDAYDIVRMKIDG